MCDDKQNHKNTLSCNKRSEKWKIKDTPQDSGVLPTIAVTLWLGWNGFVVYFILYAILLASNFQRMVILGALTLSLILPARFPGKLGQKWGDWMMRHGERYFGLKTIIEDEDDLVRHAEQNKAIIFTVNPHGTHIHMIYDRYIYLLPFTKPCANIISIYIRHTSICCIRFQLNITTSSWKAWR